MSSSVPTSASSPGRLLAEQMSAKLGVPVLDGVVCGLMVAEGLVKAGYSTSKIRRYKPC